MKKQRLIFVLCGLFQATSVCASHVPTDGRLDRYLAMSLEELMNLEVSISTDTRQPRATAPSVVTVITADDIKATGATNLVEVLESVPGIHVRTNQFGYRPLIEFRGANATQTLLMVNGNSMRDLMWGFGIFWKGLPTSIIDRVEIIRGPGSALFGADASTGVINVITRTAGKIDNTEVGARVGSFDSKSAWMQTGGNWGGFDVGMTAELHSTDGHDPFIGQDPDGDAGTAGIGWKNMDLRFSAARDDWRLHVDYARHDDLETGLTGAGVLDPVTSGEDSRLNVDLLYSNADFSRAWGLDAELRFQHLDYSSGEGFQERPPGYENTNGADNIADGIHVNGLINRQNAAERRFAAEISGLYRGFEDHAVRVGAGYTWQDLYKVGHFANYGLDASGVMIPLNSPLVDLTDSPYAFAPEKSRRIHHLFLQDVWTINDDWELTAGLRYDHYSDFGNTLNPRLALVWKSTDRLTTKLLYGQAFRPPSFQELYSPTSWSLPNPDLQPERSETIELSFGYAASRDLNLGVNLFHYLQEDFIRSVDGQFQNSGEHTIKGIEFELLWQVTRDLRLAGNYTIRDPQDNDLRFPYEPEEDAYVRADWRFRPHWNLNLQANWIGERDRSGVDARAPAGDYLVADATVRYSGLSHWEFAASVRNLFDEDAREYMRSSVPDDLPLAGRSFYLEARYEF
jgi:outer membrane receptor protein involved in Fe transport